MKKILAIILSVFMIFQVTVFADINVEIKNAKNDELKIYGGASDGDHVVLFVMDIASDAEGIADSSAGELVEANSANILYASSVEASGGQYVFEFPLSGVSGSDFYRAIVTVGDQSNQTEEFAFYPDVIKQSFISSISTGDISGANINTAVSYFSLKSFGPSSQADASGTAVSLENLRNELDGFPKVGSEEYDTDAFIRIIKKAFVLSMLNNGDASVFGADGKFLYGEEMGISALAEYDDYMSQLNISGTNFIKTSLLSANITDSEAFINRFKNLVHLNVLINYKESGSGHVPTYLNKYASGYTASSLNPKFNLNGLRECQWLTSVYGDVAGAEATSLSALASVFNTSLITNPDGDNGESGSESGSSGNFSSPGNGGGSGGGGGAGYVAPSVPVVSAGSFGDVPTDSWAYEYIDTLVKAGIINGKGDGNFAPDDNVKRGEYTKMIALAAGLTPDSSKCSFPDTIYSWSSPYVGAAVHAGLISGINQNEFAPEIDITREQAAVIIARALKLEPANPTDKFSDDSSISDWAAGLVYALRDAGILSGRDNNMLCPGDNLTRAEAAKLIAVVYELLQ